MCLYLSFSLIFRFIWWFVHVQNEALMGLSVLFRWRKSSHRCHQIQISTITKRFTASTVKNVKMYPSFLKSFWKISTQFRIIWFNSNILSFFVYLSSTLSYSPHTNLSIWKFGCSQFDGLCVRWVESANMPVLRALLDTHTQTQNKHCLQPFNHFHSGREVKW